MPTTNAAHTLDADALTHADPLVDTWQNGQGKRLYRLAGAVGSHAPVFALSNYERTVDPDSGETVETETLEHAGTLAAPRVSLENAERAILSRLDENNEPGLEMWDEMTVEMMREEFERHVARRIATLCNRGPDRNFIDLHLLCDLRIEIDRDLELRKLADASSSFNEAEWDAFVWAVEQESTYIDTLRSDETTHRTGAAYVFKPEFKQAPDWRLRAVEFMHCGILKNAPALANLAALKQEGTLTSQAELATELGKSPSTISQQMDALQEWSDRASWTCESDFPR
jgi:hypothetical protein